MNGARGCRCSDWRGRCARGVRPACPRGDVTVTTVTRHTGRERRQARQVCEVAACSGPLTPLLLWNATTLLTHRPQPFSSPRAISLRADCHLCSEKYSPFVFFSLALSPPLFFSMFSLARCCRGGSWLLSCQRPPNKPKLVHRHPPPRLLIRFHPRQPYGRIFVDLVLDFRTDYTVCAGLKTVITHSYTFYNWGHFNWIQLYWIFCFIGGLPGTTSGALGIPKPHLESQCSCVDKRRARERVAT